MSALSMTTDPGAMPCPMKEKAYQEHSGTINSDAVNFNVLSFHQSYFVLRLPFLRGVLIVQTLFAGGAQSGFGMSWIISGT